MGLIRQIPQLAHVAQHRHPAFTVRAAQDLQCRGHGLGIGVVAVVQQHTAFRHPDNPHSGAGRLIGCHAPDDLLPAEAQLLPHGHRHGCGIGHVLAGSRDGQGIGVTGCCHRAGDAVHAVIHNVADPGLAVLTLATADDPLGQRHRIQQCVIAVEDSHAVCLQMFKNLAFGL